ncbi:hypothetical protein FF011L_47400 [Roseimaritima multifibrata]|uniref:Uncharacterized protein n=1 Tax=Roseimaritima multifibrata TaxID=1930274 RepID=A0A517MM21_9BACT|nr:hypothetical protein FF011L_47400 [Roseimaritima multifibrata]
MSDVLPVCPRSGECYVTAVATVAKRWFLRHDGHAVGFQVDGRRAFFRCSAADLPIPFVLCLVQVYRFSSVRDGKMDFYGKHVGR